MQMERFMDIDPNPVKKIIKQVKYGMLSEVEIGEIREVTVLRGIEYHRSGSGEIIIPNSLHDPHMGPANRSFTCRTCHGDFQQCGGGHYGCIILSQPVFNPGYFDVIGNILQCICKHCGRLLLGNVLYTKYLKKMKTPNIEEAGAKGDLDSEGPWEEWQKVQFTNYNLVQHCTPVTTCPHCESNNGTITKDLNALSFYHNGTHLSPSMVLGLFRKMVDKDCEILYVAERPEKLIMTRILVPPLAVRPSFPDKEDDLTVRLSEVIRANKELLKGTPGSAKFLNDYKRLQLEVAQFISSDYQQEQTPLTGLVQRLRGRQGRFSGTLLGKNVIYTGRTVISPDPYLKITEAAIPLSIACRLTYPERVTTRNITKLRQCVRNGADKYPGAVFVKKDEHAMLWNLPLPEREVAANELKFGDIVDRHLEDGDIVLLNKQPSLHRMSMMCHRAKIWPGRTLKLNASVCNAYNANFDGDEMNIHVPQTEEARAEAMLLMAVSSELIPKNCTACNEYYRSSIKHVPVKKCWHVKESTPVRFDLEKNLCTSRSGEILIALSQDFLTSSFLITRKDTFYDHRTLLHIWSYMGDDMNPNDLPPPAIMKPVKRWSGKQLFSILLCPYENVNLTVKEKSYSSKHDDRNRELKTMCPNDGFVYFRNSELISGELGKATLGNGNKDGLFSVLLNDYKPDAAACCMSRLSKLSAQWIGNHGFSISIHDVKPQKELIKKKDDMIHNGYQNCEALMKTFSGIQDDNAGHIAAQSLGIKITDELNDICGALGEVCMETLHRRNSLLIMSQCGSKGSPINISQMVACVGQQLVGGCRAANEFTDRSLPHFSKQAKDPAAKGFVANSFYSGLSATQFFFHAMQVNEGVCTTVNVEDDRYVSRRLVKALENLFSHYDCSVRNTSGDIVQFLYGDDGMDPTSMEGENGKPLNLERLLLRSKAICPKDGGDEDFSSDVCEVVREKLLNLSLSDIVKSGISEDMKNFSHRISRITGRQLEVFVDTCLSRYPSKLIEAGTPIGAIGALSIGEPVAQMTLKTFRFAGDATINITCGVARINEIIYGNRYIRTPIITAILERDNSEKIAKGVKRRIEEETSQGIKTVKRVVIRKDPKTESFMLLLEGMGLRKVMSLEGVNSCKTVSNHVIEVFETLGIEAARKCIVDQLKLTMRNQGVRIDSRHIKLLADEMTFSGDVLGMSNEGFKRRGRSVLTLASIDMTSQLFDACVRGRDDPVEDVTDCIITGKPISVGTGMVEIRQKGEADDVL